MGCLVVLGIIGLVVGTIGLTGAHSQWAMSALEWSNANHSAFLSRDFESSYSWSNWNWNTRSCEDVCYRLSHRNDWSTVCNLVECRDCRSCSNGHSTSSKKPCHEEALEVFARKEGTWYSHTKATDDAMARCRKNPEDFKITCLKSAVAAFEAKKGTWYDESKAVDDATSWCERYPQAGECLVKAEKWYYEHKHGTWYDHENALDDAKKDCQSNPR